jgi:hypothetical protein
LSHVQNLHQLIGNSTNQAAIGLVAESEFSLTTFAGELGLLR